MKITGIVLIVIGILMIVFTNINFQTEKEVVDLGPIKINEKENHHIGWPTYAGGIVAIVGLGMVVVGARKK